MRELYKLSLNIRDHGGTMLESSYNYLYIPSSICNYDDSTLQRAFWLERLAVTQGDDELTAEEQSRTRTKGVDAKWQNLEYDEYYECVYDTATGEDAKIYGLFPFGAPIIRSYYMLRDWDEIVTNGYSGSHKAVDMYSRAWATDILNRTSEEGELLYYYELNRLTTSYMQNGNSKEDAFILAEKTLNSRLEGYELNSPIVSIAPGKVTAVGYNARSGFYVKIKHDNDKYIPQIQSLYVHLKRWPSVDVGDYIGAGTILGYEGTTGRSTGNHLHIEVKVGGRTVDPKTYMMPVFSPFFYDKKAKAVLDENAEKALGNEYYDLERTILPETALFNTYNVINGMKLKDGTTINYTAPTNRGTPYNSGDSYDGAASEYNAIWGNNVPSKPLSESLEDIMDLDLLNKNIEYDAPDDDTPDGKELTYKEKERKEIVANPAVFFNDQKEFEKRHTNFTVDGAFDDNGMHVRLAMPKWYAVELSGYRSNLEVPYYNGPRSKEDVITSEEAVNDLKKMQDMLKKLGYYTRAEVDFVEAGYGIYTELFEKVVRAMQRDLVERGFGVYNVVINGKLDVNTVAAYNTMVHYVTAENQFAMADKAAYNAGVDLSIEPAMIWAIIASEGEDGNKDELSLKESEEEIGTQTFEYEGAIKTFTREQGLMQIKPSTAVKRYQEKKIDKEDAVMFVRRPMQNTVMGTELFKEYMQYFLDNYHKEIDTAKNEIIFGRKTYGYWYNVYASGTYYDYRWVDYYNIDRAMLYALALDAYDKRDPAAVQVDSILTNGPTGYAEKAMGRFLGYILDEKDGTGVVSPDGTPIAGNASPETETPTSSGLTMPPEDASKAALTEDEFATLLEELQKHLGKPYVRGAAGPESFDCSGLVLYSYNQTEVRFVGYHTASYIFSKNCVSVPYENAQPGDLFFYSSDGTVDGIYHVEIYIGNGQTIEAKGKDYGVITSTAEKPTFVGRL